MKITKAIDKLGQEVLIGDYITIVERGMKTVSFGKVVGFNPSGSPRYKKTNKSSITSPGYTKNWYAGGKMESQFLKVNATREMDLYYENN